jgi:DMSO/TMAO reductase YedYZ molybdopterin-dependent catalytic subunit
VETLTGLLWRDRTPNEGFFVREHFPRPLVSLAEWRLDVDGLVARPLQYRISDLKAAPRRTVVATLECAGNGRKGFGKTAAGEIAWGEGAVSTASWEGIPLRWFLQGSAASGKAREVVVTGYDSRRRKAGRPNLAFARALPVRIVQLNPDILVALRMNGRPLPRSHGAPARLIVPGWYAMASVKWLRTITAVDRPFRGPFQSEKYVYRGDPGVRSRVEPVQRIRVKSLTTSPQEGARVRFGRVTSIRGRAWSGHGRVVRVEVDTGEGWTRARLAKNRGQYDWVGWRVPWRPHTLGENRIRVRATDASGSTQPARPRENRFQYGFNAIRSVRVFVVR